MFANQIQTDVICIKGDRPVDVEDDVNFVLQIIRGYRYD